MDEWTEYRTMEVAEDAADGCLLLVPKPKPDWHCECGTRNEGRDVACQYCGRVQEDADE